ncbi:MAG TPA: family 1 glycosylhydrolase [Chthoniobacterales bacterium]|jgi:dTDP-4-dehydrorhamnose reductase|nr:family 1 glycosylhydrolase [Chthoniobacterales bacterium]
MNLGTEKSLQLWGGVECSINRVRDRFFNQLERNGHWQRPDDLERFRRLGLSTLRFPLLWESVAREASGDLDWSWPDDRLAEARELGIRPIAGLLHHGSGPLGTDLLDPEFPRKFAGYAGEVARRYPWIDAYTPINEPLTTARFSALYGHWYPHQRDDQSFARALLNQCRATVLAMRAIREVNPTAELIQTDDLGKTYSTRALSYQADFENDRRWITWDLLSGKVDRSHPLRSYFKWAGIPTAELDIFLEEPCPPDILGLNHYVTSERFLDENISAYPPESHGRNGRVSYADIAAVRSTAVEVAGPEKLLIEAWERYHIPIAITEAHLGCTVDEQLRWFMDIWNAAGAARANGADVRAVTVWALLGSFDWDNLVTRDNGHYEPGVFDLRGGGPRPTLLAEMVRQLAAAGAYDHPLLATAGWWHRDRCGQRHAA